MQVRSYHASECGVKAMRADEFLVGIYGAATISCDGVPEAGRVHLLLVRHVDGDNNAQYRWYGSNDGYDWFDTLVWGETSGEASLAAAEAWGDDHWDLQWPWDYRK